MEEYTPPVLVGDRPNETTTPKFGQDGKEVVYIGGYGNNQKEVDATAWRLSTSLGAVVTGVTALNAFEQPEVVRDLIEGEVAEEARHIIVTSAGAAALRGCGIERAASFTSYAGAEKTQAILLPFKLLKLFASQIRQMTDPKSSPEDRKTYKHAVLSKLKEFTTFSREGWNGWRYMRQLGAIARTSTLEMAVEFRKKEVPALVMLPLKDEMGFFPGQHKISRSRLAGVEVKELQTPPFDHERIVTHTEQVAAQIAT